MSSLRGLRGRSQAEGEHRVYWRCPRGDDSAQVLRTLVAEAWKAAPGDVSLGKTGEVPRASVTLPDGRVREVAVSRASSHGLHAVACAGPRARTPSEAARPSSAPRAEAAPPPEAAPGLGIDVEVLGPFLDSGTAPEPFASVVLGATEREWFDAMAGEDPTVLLTALLRAWVRKEAVLKALHSGLDTARGGLAPSAVECSAPGEEPRCLSHSGIRLRDHVHTDPVLGTVLVSTALLVRTG